MTQFKEFHAKSLDEAIREACAYFGVEREKLEIEIVSDAKTGIFGLVGAKKATIRAARRQVAEILAALEEREPAGASGKTAVARHQDAVFSVPDKSRKAGGNDADAPRRERSGKGRENSGKAQAGGAATKAAGAPKSGPGPKAAPASQSRTTAKAEGGTGSGAVPRHEAASAPKSRTAAKAEDAARSGAAARNEAAPGTARPSGRRATADAGGNAQAGRPAGAGSRDGAKAATRESARRPQAAPSGHRGGEPRSSSGNGRHPDQDSLLSADAFRGDDLPEFDLSSCDPEMVKARTAAVVARLVSPIVGDVPCTVSIGKDRVRASVDCGDASGLLVGREGQTLASIQYLATRILARELGGALRLHVDVGNYREKQDDRVKELALGLAARAKKTGRPQMTRPLSAYQRRIVHLSLEGDAEVGTRSRGEGAQRRVMIYLKTQGENIPADEHADVAPVHDQDPLSGFEESGAEEAATHQDRASEAGEINRDSREDRAAADRQGNKNSSSV